jgi:Flp pilus assembly pilin Flp
VTNRQRALAARGKASPHFGKTILRFEFRVPTQHIRQVTGVEKHLESEKGERLMLRRFWNDESGMETVEYAVMAALIVVGVIAVVRSIGGKVLDSFESLDSALTPPAA